jgi:hypothetical protein
VNVEWLNRAQDAAYQHLDGESFAGSPADVTRAAFMAGAKWGAANADTSVTAEYLTDALEEVARTLHSTGESVDQGTEFPSLTIDSEARDGYSHACHDIADAVERRSIAGGVLRRVGAKRPPRMPGPTDLSLGRVVHVWQGRWRAAIVTDKPNVNVLPVALVLRANGADVMSDDEYVHLGELWGGGMPVVNDPPTNVDHAAGVWRWPPRV